MRDYYPRRVYCVLIANKSCHTLLASGRVFLTSRILAHAIFHATFHNMFRNERRIRSNPIAANPMSVSLQEVCKASPILLTLPYLGNQIHITTS